MQGKHSNRMITLLRPNNKNLVHMSFGHDCHSIFVIFCIVSKSQLKILLHFHALKTLTSLNREFGLFSTAIIAFGVLTFSLLLAITTLRDFENYLSFAIIASGAFELFIPNTIAVGKMESKQSRILCLRRRSSRCQEIAVEVPCSLRTLTPLNKEVRPFS